MTGATYTRRVGNVNPLTPTELGVDDTPRTNFDGIRCRRHFTY